MLFFNKNRNIDITQNFDQDQKTGIFHSASESMKGKLKKITTVSEMPLVIVLSLAILLTATGLAWRYVSSHYGDNNSPGSSATTKSANNVSQNGAPSAQKSNGSKNGTSTPGSKNGTSTSQNQGKTNNSSPSSSSGSPEEISTNPAIFFLPHQDDDMWLDGAIKDHVDAGRIVYVVMITDGESSGARDYINGKHDDGTLLPCNLGNECLNPKASGYSPLNKRAFVAARNVEFYSSMRALGIPADHIRFANQDVNPSIGTGESYLIGWSQPRYKDDGSLTESDVTNVINYYYHKYGRGSYKAIATGAGSPYSGYVQHDHQIIFNALRDYTNISDKRYYTDTFNPSGMSSGFTEYKIMLSGSELAAKRTALNNYFVWGPQNGRYAVGAHSVQATLNTWMSNNFEYEMVPK
jgi:hypothetical protein